MVHLPPLPGSPGWSGSMDAVLSAVEADVAALHAAGVDGILVENFGDVPFRPDAVGPATISALTRAVLLARELTDRPVGVNVLRNDALAALGIAAATGAAFVRVNVHVGTMHTDQGPLVGRADETLRMRAWWGVTCAIWADVHVKHATPVAGETLESAARDSWERGRADALVVSGTGTGRRTDPERIRRVQEAVPEAPVWVGSGVDPESLASLPAGVAGVIVGSWMQEEGRAGGRVDPDRARQMARAVGRLRAGD
jgi:membrane complex biogenesis BtpA family protein